MTLAERIALADRRAATRLFMARHQAVLSETLRAYRPGHV